jgi:hypothetical protein
MTTGTNHGDHKVASGTSGERPALVVRSFPAVPLYRRYATKRGKQAKHSLQAATWSVGSPRRDSNPRPSDYESDRNPPTGPAHHHSGCSGAGPIPSRPVLYRLVVAPGLPERLPTCGLAQHPCGGMSTLSIRSQSEGRSGPKLMIGSLAVVIA